MPKRHLSQVHEVSDSERPSQILRPEWESSVSPTQTPHLSSQSPNQINEHSESAGLGNEVGDSQATGANESSSGGQDFSDTLGTDDDEVMTMTFYDESDSDIFDDEAIISTSYVGKGKGKAREDAVMPVDPRLTLLANYNGTSLSDNASPGASPTTSDPTQDTTQSRTTPEDANTSSSNASKDGTPSNTAPTLANTPAIPGPSNAIATSSNATNNASSSNENATQAPSLALPDIFATNPSSSNADDEPVIDKYIRLFHRLDSEKPDGQAHTDLENLRALPLSDQYRICREVLRRGSVLLDSTRDIPVSIKFQRDKPPVNWRPFLTSSFAQEMEHVLFKHATLMWEDMPHEPAAVNHKLVALQSVALAKDFRPSAYQNIEAAILNLKIVIKCSGQSGEYQVTGHDILNTLHQALPELKFLGLNFYFIVRLEGEYSVPLIFPWHTIVSGLNCQCLDAIL